MSKEKSKQTVQTTGHAWDGDLQEFNNPLPTWWLWGFYATVVFALIYWVLYPAWPVGKDYTKGTMNEISYTTADGREVTTHWNTRALLGQEMQQARQEQQKYIDQLMASGYEEIAADPEKSGFAYSTAKVLFADNCAACHQAGGAGVIGMYPNLADDDWLWGGGYAQIETSLRDGRRGFMPGFKQALSTAQVEELAEYVLSLSGHNVDTAKAARGGEIFNGETGGCHYCHTREGTGMQSLGSANLTDNIWTIINVPAEETAAGKRKAIMQVIRDGVTREMPAWKERLSDTEIKILTFYVHELGGGK